MTVLNKIIYVYDTIKKKKKGQVNPEPIKKKSKFKKNVTRSKKKKKEKPLKEYYINLALGSGMARGYAHIPIIQSLIKKNIKFKEISGTSAGSIIGAYLALYGEVDSFEIFLKTLKKRDFLKLIHINNPRKSLVKLDRVKKLFTQLFKDKEFKDTKIPLVICATRINTNEPVYIRSGKIIDAVMASISIPGLFPSYVIKKSHYVDGGIVDPLPIDCFKDKELKTVAVDLYRVNKGHIRNYSAINVALLSYYIMEERITAKTKFNPNMVFMIKPNFGKEKLDALDFSNYHKFNKPGATMIKSKINKIVKWLKEKNVSKK